MQDTITESLVPNIVHVVMRQCTPGWRIYEQRHPVCNITYVVKGNARYTINGVGYDLEAGDLLCLPAGSKRAGITFRDRLMQCFSVDFRLTDMNGKNAELPFPIVNHIGIVSDINDLFHELFFTWMDRQPAYLIKVHGLFNLLLSRFFELIINPEFSAKDFRINKVYRYIASHYYEKLTVKKMAEMVGMNPHYFGARFIQETGLTLHRYLTGVRVKNAESMLISGEYTVEGAAEACGFADVAHFYKRFKEIKGIPPSHNIPKKRGYGTIGHEVSANR